MLHEIVQIVEMISSTFFCLWQPWADVSDHQGMSFQLEMQYITYIHKCPMMQMGAGAMLLIMLTKIVGWASAFRPAIALHAWKRAVGAMQAAEKEQQSDYSTLFEAMKVLLDGIAHPVLILVRELLFRWNISLCIPSLLLLEIE